MKTNFELHALQRLFAAAAVGIALGVLPPRAVAQESPKEMAKAAETTAGERAKQGDYLRGLKAWEQNCARCHNARDPKEYTDALWKPVITHMRIRAGLTGQQARDILKFIQDSN